MAESSVEQLELAAARAAAAEAAAREYEFR